VCQANLVVGRPRGSLEDHEVDEISSCYFLWRPRSRVAKIGDRPVAQRPEPPLPSRKLRRQRIQGLSYQTREAQEPDQIVEHDDQPTSPGVQHSVPGHMKRRCPMVAGSAVQDSFEIAALGRTRRPYRRTVYRPARDGFSW
jgi:hypothetical protein